MADRLIDTITDRFLALASFPYLGRSREEDFGPGYRSLAVGEYVIVYCAGAGIKLFEALNEEGDAAEIYLYYIAARWGDVNPV